MDTGRVVFSSKVSWFLVVFGVWSWIIWPTFVKNVAADPRSFAAGSPTPFFLVHMVLTVVSLAFGTAIGVLGVRGLLAIRKNKAAKDKPADTKAADTKAADTKPADNETAAADN
jgi:hypothetical protein